MTVHVCPTCGLPGPDPAGCDVHRADPTHIEWHEDFQDLQDPETG